jgi:hypothetical protein
MCLKFIRQVAVDTACLEQQHFETQSKPLHLRLGRFGFFSRLAFCGFIWSAALKRRAIDSEALL